MTNEELKQWFYDNFEFTYDKHASILSGGQRIDFDMAAKSDIGYFLYDEWFENGVGEDKPMYIKGVKDQTDLIAWPIYDFLSRYYNVGADKVDRVVQELHREIKKRDIVL